MNRINGWVTEVSSVMMQWRLVLLVGLVGVLAETAGAADESGPASAAPATLPFTLNIAAPAWDLDDLDARAKTGADALFNEGSWIFQTYGSATFNDDKGSLYRSHTGVGYFVADNLSLNLEAAAGGIDSKDSREPDGYALGLDFLVRWHFLKNEGASLFAEGGTGLIWTENPFPAGGTHQSFILQAGIGGMGRLFDNVYLMGGIRWHHISNARKAGIHRNPGFDAPMVYIGIMIPF